VQTITLQLSSVTPLQPHLNQPVEHKNSIKNTRTASRTQEQLQENLHQLHQNATKRTNEISPQANPSVDRALPYFSQEISLNLVKNCSQNQRRELSREKSRVGRREEQAGRWRRLGALRGHRPIFSRVWHPIVPGALDKGLVAPVLRDASSSQPTWTTPSHSWPAYATGRVSMQEPSWRLPFASSRCDYAYSRPTDRKVP
jgi:hypothetical protein